MIFLSDGFYSLKSIKKHKKSNYLCDWLVCVECTVYGLPFKRLNFPTFFLSPHNQAATTPQDECKCSTQYFINDWAYYKLSFEF